MCVLYAHFQPQINNEGGIFICLMVLTAWVDGEMQYLTLPELLSFILFSYTFFVKTFDGQLCVLSAQFHPQITNEGGILICPMVLVSWVDGEMHYLTLPELISFISFRYTFV